MAQRIGIGRLWRAGLPVLLLSGMVQAHAWAQGPKRGAAEAPPAPAATLEQPDAHRVRQGLARLLDGYPPSLRAALAIDSTLLNNEAYLAPYPALVNYLNAHPEIARNPAFYIGENSGFRAPRDPKEQAIRMWDDVVRGLGVFAGFGMAIGVVVWIIRTIVDYRRWSRLAKVQTDAHTKLLDRFTANEDLIRYIESPAGSKFLESSPIKLDAGPRGVGAPLGRILWSVQGGVVLVAIGIGLQVVGGQVGSEGAEPLRALGVLGIASGIGFVVSAIISYFISHRLGLIERTSADARIEPPKAELFGDRR